MAIYDGGEHHYDDDPAPAALESYAAGVNHEDLLLCGPDNDTQWVLSDHHVGLEEIR